MMMQNIENKVVLITGASRGLGKNMALHLADQGRDIILTYFTNKQEADLVVKAIENRGRKAVALQLDVRNTKSFTDFSDKVKQQLQTHWQRDQFDYLINNAGSGVYKTFVETTEADFDQMSNEHLKGPFFLTQKLLPLIKDGGRILNVSSGLTRFAYPGFVAYSIMKAAVELLTLYLAKELGERRISVNTIAPGAIETDFGGGMVRDNKEVNDHIAQLTALGRVGQPDDIGGAVAAILSDEAGWINAQRIEASGGQGI
jgi:NAD(P)-dependent dehydrogenase (short-subunit alcohol dehydrogenase family)